MTNPILTSLDELSKACFLLMRFIDGDDIDEFNQELQKLGIEEGFGARAKAIEKCEDPVMKGAMVEAYFPQSRQSDPFCSYTAACNQAIVDLQKSGLFRRRV